MKVFHPKRYREPTPKCNMGSVSKDMTRFPPRIAAGLIIGVVGLLMCVALLGGCSVQNNESPQNGAPTSAESNSSTDMNHTDSSHESDAKGNPQSSQEFSVTSGTEMYRDFTLDNVLHLQSNGDIHFNLYVPDSYDGSQPAALFVTLPGYQGLYFQGVGENIETENFGFEAQAYDPNMIVVAPQLSDWKETSARQTIDLVEYFLSAYNIDSRRVYLEGYSGGGETLSLVMGMRPDLFTAALFCSSQWDGDLSVLVDARVPVYMVVGENDEYYGSEPAQQAANQLQEMYRDAGLSPEQIRSLVTLDVKPSTYFENAGITNQHGGGGMLFSHDSEIMGWLFGEH